MKAYLLLEDGTFLEGSSIGANGTTVGEICFNTGMTGYQETYTDPSYYGQILIQTHIHIGNYGVSTAETETDTPKISGLVVKTFASDYSRDLAEDSLDNFLKKHNVVGIEGIDTRAIVSHIREKGAMNGIISSEISSKNELLKHLRQTPSMKGLELASKVSTKEPYFFGEQNAKYKVAVLDLGIKRSILKNFVERDTYCKVYPYDTSFEEMEKWSPHAYFISNGPGDPEPLTKPVETIKQIIANDKPVFGICLGHQLLGLSQGISTFKMENGHRGPNHPVKNIVRNILEVTAQNHGFGIREEDVKKHEGIEITHINLNDNSVEGIKLVGKKAFSVQYHPEASPGPHDSRYLFDDFIEML